MLEGKVALVTGGSRGIGKAICLAFAAAGCDVVVNYGVHSLNAERVKKAAERLGVRAMAARADVSDRTQVRNMVARCLKAFGRLDVLVTNAGVWKYEPIDSKSQKRLAEAVGVNIVGVFNVINAVVPHMKKRKSGVIVTISSTAGQRGEAFHSAYAASKGAVISLTKSLAVELAPHNIRVNCVAPGWIYTDMTRPPLRSPERKTILSLIPMGRVGTAEEIAGPVLFLASDLASFITGEILNVNGGAVLCG
ncbi:MAG: 3-oxoacyl-ACP reductase FabG [Candidatus Eisenbacteria bacterium]|nr:3-oxoacyl-ACP reductase FabG [Candidatus Eisenbacteria bacterium]